MNKTILAIPLMLAGLSPLASYAQDFGVMQSAEIIKQGNIKLSLYPMFVDGTNGGGNDTGFVAGLGYGFTQNFDAEIKFASHDNVSYIGADAEFALLKNQALDVSLTLGGSIGNADRRFSDTTTLGAGLSVSGHATENLEWGGTLSFNRVKLDDAPRGTDDNFNQVHLVPGIEYRLSDTIDLLAEYGIGLNDEAADYFAAGLAFYFQ